MTACLEIEESEWPKYLISIPIFASAETLSFYLTVKCRDEFCTSRFCSDWNDDE